MQRRDFLIAGSMGAVFSVASRAGVAMAGSNGSSSIPAVPWPAVQAVVYEPRYLLAREFARLRVARGARAFGTDECIVRLWRGPLAELLGRERVLIAGLTAHSDFAIARDCARERSLRVLHEARSRSGPVTLVSWLIGT